MFNWFGGHDEPWRKVKIEKPVEAVDPDSGELVEIPPTQIDPNDVDGLMVAFSYTDAKGYDTRRTVLCYRCWEAEGIVYLAGYCTLRHELRTFRADRMRDLREVRVGRKINDPLKYFGNFLALRDASAPALVADRTPMASIFHAGMTQQQLEQWTARRQREIRARETCIDGLRVLSYIALADDVVTEQEKNIELSYIEAQLAMAGFDHDPAINDAMMHIVGALAVPTRSYVKAINAIRADEAYFRLVLDAATRMAEATPHLNRTERGALAKLLQAAHAVKDG